MVNEMAEISPKEYHASLVQGSCVFHLIDGESIRGFQLTGAQCGSSGGEGGLEAAHDALGGGQVGEQQCDIQRLKSASGHTSAAANDGAHASKVGSEAG
jgi:hypothetical protein